MSKKMNEKEMERILKIMANKRRLEIVKYLRNKKEATVTDISNKIKISFKATSKHLNLLYAGDIVDRKQRSLKMFYFFNPTHSLIIHISNSLE